MLKLILFRSGEFIAVFPYISLQRDYYRVMELINVGDY